MNIFEEVKSQLDIKQVIDFYGYSINRKGWFICPFHGDSNPSASIKNDYFHCFVCDAGGDLITFTAKLHGMSNIDACKKLIEDFGLSIACNNKQDNISRLKADRERQKRLAKNKEREQKERLIHGTGDILADYHRFLFQGRFYPVQGQRYELMLMYLPQAEYYLECYDNEPEQFSLQNRKLVKEIERRLSVWNN